MQHTRTLLPFGLCLTMLGATLSAAGCVAHGDGSRDLSVKEIGSLHVGGRAVTLSGLPLRDGATANGRTAPPVDPNGDFEVEQMYAQYVKLTAPRAKYPLLLAHGGGLTGVTYETKPDGAPGWQMFFLHATGNSHMMMMDRNSDAVARVIQGWITKHGLMR